MVTALGLPAIQRVTYQKATSTTRKFIGLIRTIRNDSILLNSMHRLVLDLDKKTWWVEMQNAFQLLEEPGEQPEKKSNGKKKGKGREEAPRSSFSISEKFSKEPVDMPAGVEFAGVLKEKEGYIRQGTVAIHFFPNGFNDQAILHLKRSADEKIAFSLVLRPNSGRVELFREQVNSFDVVPTP